MDENWSYEETSCDCTHSEFKDNHHNHVVTGNLRIIKEKHLQELCRKGPNYREQNGINWSTTCKALEESVNTYTETWSRKENQDKSCFSEWKAHLMKAVTEKIESLKETEIVRPKKKTLNRKEAQDELKRLQEKYVIVPIDKTSNNIGFICKRYYYKILKDELQTDTKKY